MSEFILVVNGYKIKNEIIGMGSFGTCYRCEHDNLKQFQICAKIINLKHELDYNMEIKSLKKLWMIQNDYIIKIFDIIQQDNRLYIFMEEQLQGDLGELIRKRREKRQKFKVDEVLKIIKQIARGYKILYMQQIIHRSLKPSNILQGNNGLLQITDFGLCEFQKDMCQLFLNQSNKGGVYFSPQIFENTTYTSKCDMYSLGAIIYELIYGKPLMNKIEEKIFFPTCFLDFSNEQQGEFQENQFLKTFLFRSLQIEEKDRLSWEELFKQIDDLEIFQTQQNNNSLLDITLSDFNCSKGFELYQKSQTTNILKIIQFIFIKISFLEHLQIKQDAFFKNKTQIGLVSTFSFHKYSQKLLKAYSHSIFFNLYHFLFKRDNNLEKLQIVKELQNNYEESVKFFIESDDLEINNYKNYIQQFYLGQKQQLYDELKLLASDQNFKMDLSIFFKRDHYLNYLTFVQAFQQTLKQLSKVYPNKENKEFVEYMAFSYRFLRIQNDFPIRSYRTANSQDILYFQTDYNYLKDYVRLQSIYFC